MMYYIALLLFLQGSFATGASWSCSIPGKSPGWVVGDGAKEGVASEDACKDLCAAETECKAIIYRLKEQSCFLLPRYYNDNFERTDRSDDAIVANFGTDQSCANPIGKADLGWSCSVSGVSPGYVIGGGEKKGVATEDACKALCVADPKCQAMIYRLKSQGCYILPRTYNANFKAASGSDDAVVANYGPGLSCGGPPPPPVVANAEMAVGATLPSCDTKQSVSYSTAIVGFDCSNSYSDAQNKETLCAARGNELRVCPQALPNCEGYSAFEKWGKCKAGATAAVVSGGPPPPAVVSGGPPPLSATLPSCDTKQSVSYSTAIVGFDCSNSYSDAQNKETLCAARGNELRVCPQALPKCEGYSAFEKWGKCKAGATAAVVSGGPPPLSATLPSCDKRDGVSYSTGNGCSNSYSDAQNKETLCAARGNELRVCPQALPNCEGYAAFRSWGKCTGNSAESKVALEAEKARLRKVNKALRAALEALAN